MSEILRITAKRDGYRRCGVAHHGTRDHDADRFSPEETERLEADPMLVVQRFFPGDLPRSVKEDIAESIEEADKLRRAAEADRDAAAKALAEAKAEAERVVTAAKAEAEKLLEAARASGDARPVTSESAPGGNDGANAGDAGTSTAAAKSAGGRRSKPKAG
ncbi:MAG: HI1506-related protein [Gammaproteobacteria bacterium]|nr:HI1506-related protein [Gammaproteobacteria bacterium]